MNGFTTRACAGLILALSAGGAGASQATDPATGEPPGNDFHQIMGQIAADRGATAAAAEEFLEAAERSDDPAASARAVDYAFAHGFDAWALRGARRWVQLAPDDPSARLVLARLFLRRNDVAGAVAEVERALGPAAGRSDADYALLADELRAEENAEGVVRVLTRIAATGPASPALDLAIAEAALRAANLDLAEYQARAVIAGAPPAADHDRAAVVVGRVLLGRGQAAEAIAWLQGQVQARPSLDLEIELAGVMAAADRPDEASARIDAIGRTYGTEPEVRRLRAMVALGTNDLKTAWDSFNTLVDDDEYADEARYHLADIAAREQRFDQSLKLLGRIGEGEYLLPAQETIARIAEASGDVQSASQILDRLATAHPQRAFDVARSKAAMLQRLKRDEEALAVLGDILRYRPDDAEVLMSRGALLEKLGRFDAALDDMAAAARLFPDNALVANAYGYTLANRTRRQAEAAKLVRRALEREPANAAIIDSYGWVLYRQKRLAEARSYLQLAHSLFPDPEVSAHLGEVMWKQGERDAARRLWAEALEKAPESQPLIDTMVRFAD